MSSPLLPYINAFKGKPDAMNIASVAVRDKSPIVLTDGKSVPFNTTRIESYIIGVTSSMSGSLVKVSKIAFTK
ncbi:hypothetical protein IM33_13320 [Clostridioides difficile]|nr:hypothetical protein IM33_13320 [Clostridioides difficile]